MKSIQKTKRVQLKTTQKDDSFVLGIVSAEPDYKLSLALNNKFSISLKIISPLKVRDENENDLVFSRFSDISNSPEVAYNLISNRAGKSFLIKKLKNIDYIFQIQDNYNTDSDSFTKHLRELESITAVFIIDLNKIKDKNSAYLIQ